MNINDLKLNSLQEPTTPIDKLNTPRTVTVSHTAFFPPSPTTVEIEINQESHSLTSINENSKTKPVVSTKFEFEVINEAGREDEDDDIESNKSPDETMETSPESVDLNNHNVDQNQRNPNHSNNNSIPGVANETYTSLSPTNDINPIDEYRTTSNRSYDVRI